MWSIFHTFMLIRKCKESYVVFHTLQAIISHISDTFTVYYCTNLTFRKDRFLESNKNNQTKKTKLIRALQWMRWMPKTLTYCAFHDYIEEKMCFPFSSYIIIITTVIQMNWYNRCNVVTFHYIKCHLFIKYNGRT